MHISWLGNTAMKIQTKPLSEDVTIVIDPYKPEKGAFPRSLTPHIALFSRGEKGSITLSGDPFSLSSPGECETKGVLITATQGEDADHVIFRVDTEGMSLVHLGESAKQLTEAQKEAVNGTDILCIPIGGENTYDADQALKVINTIEPRVVIPIAHKCDNAPKAKDIESFLKTVGMKTDKPEKKVILKKKDMPQEDMLVINLTKE